MKTEDPNLENENSQESVENTQENTSENNEQNPANEVDENAQLKQEVNELKDKYLRLLSDFDNFRKRTIKEKSDLILNANESLIQGLLPVLDDFERARKSYTGSEDPEAKAIGIGVELVYHKFVKILQSKGLNVMDVKAGDDFNMDLHEGITQIAAPSEELKGKVVDCVEHGYLLNEKVIRYAKVVIGQ